MKKRGIFLLTVFLLTGVLYAAAIREGGADSAGGGRSGELILLHTNDLHGAFLPNKGRDP